MASPAMRPLTEGSKWGDALPLEKSKAMTAEEIKDEMERLCFDAKWLQTFYKEVDKVNMATASPSVQPAVPELSLPPRSKLAM